MAYRRTAKTEAKLAGKRAAIVKAARTCLAHGGFGAAQISQVAAAAGIATGTVYRYFPSKAALFAEIFEDAARRETAVMQAITEGPGSPAMRLKQAVEAYARRAVRGRRLAWALIAEPVAPEIEAERWTLRAAYRDILARLIDEGIASGAFPPQDAMVSAAAVVGAMIEPLIGPLSTLDDRIERDAEWLIASTVQFCVAAVSGAPPAEMAAAASSDR